MIGLYAIVCGLAVFMGAVVVFGLTGQVWAEVGIGGVLLFWVGMGIAGAGYLLRRRTTRRKE